MEFRAVLRFVQEILESCEPNGRQLTDEEAEREDMSVRVTQEPPASS